MYNVVIIGLGRQGKLYLESALNLHKNNQINILALCDKDKEFMDGLDLENIDKFTDYQELLKTYGEKIHLLILCLPNDQYQLIIKDCKQYSFTILKEKPYAATINEYGYYKNENFDIHVAQQRYFMAGFQKAKNRIDNGLIGNVLFFDYFYCLNDTRESRYWDQKQGGGAWINIGRHLLFVIIWFFGDIESSNINKMITHKRSWEYNTDDTITYNFSTVSKIQGRGFLSVVDVYKQKHIQIIGEKGTILIKKGTAILMDNFETIIEEVCESENLEIYSDQILFFANTVKNKSAIEKFNQINESSMKQIIKYF